ncbi:hypothetical protein [Mesorhizobium helmanticense]|uniref:Uncharacterized protein n=1 Tax=Mesorhizobium helmanticense TaxID=1776423 RepID=A0A2T4J335_9HYPH|nr:hypothetical protein [Mesorhizobium helmanticense]PTE12257.1 hypothetical protein C9427_01320 [Mesorhizobium helmanticense]
MADEIRTDHIYRRAHVLAESGVHSCPAEVVAMLLAEGYPEAAELLNSDNIRADLRRVCEAADKGRLITTYRALRH